MLQSFTNNDIIDILMDENINYREIVVKLAKRHPEILWKLTKGDILDKEKEELEIFNNDLVRTFGAHDKISAIKTLREKFGHKNMGLKEAVDYYKNLLKEHGFLDEE
jgi:ribosomal protein L7/L12